MAAASWILKKVAFYLAEWAIKLAIFEAKIAKRTRDIKKLQETHALEVDDILLREELSDEEKDKLIIDSARKFIYG